MAKTTGWQIGFVIIGVIALLNVIAPYLTKLAEQRGDFTALIVFALIIYLLFKEYKT